MEVNLEYKGVKLLLVYNTVLGSLDYIKNLDTGKNMIMEYTQAGAGYEFSRHNGFVAMDMCEAIYVRIMELDLFVPKFIFIPNEEIKE